MNRIAQKLIDTSPRWANCVYWAIVVRIKYRKHGVRIWWRNTIYRYPNGSLGEWPHAMIKFPDGLMLGYVPTDDTAKGLTWFPPWVFNGKVTVHDE